MDGIVIVFDVLHSSVVQRMGKGGFGFNFSVRVVREEEEVYQ